MASLTSLAMLGTTKSNPSISLDNTPAFVRPTSLLLKKGCCSSLKFIISSNGGRRGGRRRSRRGGGQGGQDQYCWVCRCSTTTVTTTDLVAELGNSLSSEPAFHTTASDDDSDLALKPAPKPVLRPSPRAAPVLPVNSPNLASWDPSSKSAQDPCRLESEQQEGNDEVIQSLGEVLDKAEKLETAAPWKTDRKEVGVDNRLASAANSIARNGRAANMNPNRNSKTLKSVWRRGNPISSAEKVSKDPPNLDKENPTSGIEGGKPRIQARIPFKPQPRLQEKPAVASQPALKKPVILKDVGASPKIFADPETLKPKERKPILIDKFAPKKPVMDPLIEQVVLPPPKPAKSSGIPKAKDERRKKSGALGALRRRILDDSAIADDETSELNVPIPGADARKGRKWSKASRKAARLEAAKAAAPVKVEILEVGEEGMLIDDLAYNLAVSEAQIFEYLYSKGIKPDSIYTLDKNLVKMICKEFEVEFIEGSTIKVEDMAKKKEILDEEDLDMLEDRPPVLTIMGHVDHGKTTLLDYIRKSRVAASEAGGITQGIGAYKVLVPVDGKQLPCVFLDTPGHEAFGAMRARGARVTDIAIIVVAADDGVLPQTNEAIAHAKAAGVPIVVAINKIDKDGANPEKVMQELSSLGLMPEDWGGDVPMVQISALKGENVDDLLDTVMLIAELQELKANPHRNAKGTVIEAGLLKSKGPVATFIVQNGTLKRGDVVVCGETFGKVRALFDDRGGNVDKAGPSTAVQVIGLSNVPIAGDEFEVVDSIDIAREKAEVRGAELRVERISAKAGEGKVTLSAIASTVSPGHQTGLDLHQLNVILKVDFQGSIEAIRRAIQVLPQDNVNLKFLLQAPGDISNSDIDLAVATKAVIFGFNVKVPGSVKSYADNKGVEIRTYRVIYDLIDDLRNAMEGLLEPVEEQIPIGGAEVRATFSSGSGRVAGCMVTEGKVMKGCCIRIIRNGKTIYRGTLDSLRRVKEMVKEVGAGLECGIAVNDYADWEVGDIVKVFNTVKKQRTLEEASASVTTALAEAGVEL